MGDSLDLEAEAVGPKRSSSEIDHESKQKDKTKNPKALEIQESVLLFSEAPNKEESLK